MLLRHIVHLHVLYPIVLTTGNTFCDICLLTRSKSLSQTGSTLKGKNLLLMEQIPSFKSRPHWKGRQNKKNTELLHLKIYSFSLMHFISLQILGCGVLGIGVWLLVKEFSTREMSAIMGSRLVEMVTYGLIGGGGAATVLAFCGCCGTMKQERFVLGFVSIHSCCYNNQVVSLAYA